MTIDSLSGEELQEEQLRWHRAHVKISQENPMLLLKCAVHLIGGMCFSIPLISQVSRLALQSLCNTQRAAYYLDYLEAGAFNEAFRLIEKGLSPSITSRDGKTFIDYLLDKGKFNIAEYQFLTKLLKLRSSFNPTHPNLATYFGFAANMGDCTTMALLIAGGFTPSTDLIKTLLSTPPVKNEEVSCSQQFGYPLPNTLPLPSSTVSVVDNKAPNSAFNTNNQQLLNLISILKNQNAIITGKTGVGKRSLVKLLHEKIRSGDVPEELKGKVILEMRFFHFLLHYQHNIDKLTQLLTSGNILLLILDVQATTDDQHSTIPQWLQWLECIYAEIPIKFILTTNTDHYKGLHNYPPVQRAFGRIHLENHSKAEQLHCINEAKILCQRYYGIEMSTSVIKTLLAKVKAEISTKDLLCILQRVFEKLSDQFEKKAPILIDRVERAILSLKKEKSNVQYLSSHNEGLIDQKLAERVQELSTLKEKQKIVEPFLVQKRKVKMELKAWSHLACQMNAYPDVQKQLEEKIIRSQRELTDINAHLSQEIAPFLMAADEELLDECIAFVND